MPSGAFSPDRSKKERLVFPVSCLSLSSVTCDDFRTAFNGTEMNDVDLAPAVSRQLRHLRGFAASLFLKDAHVIDLMLGAQGGPHLLGGSAIPQASLSSAQLRSRNTGGIGEDALVSIAPRSAAHRRKSLPHSLGMKQLPSAARGFSRSACLLPVSAIDLSAQQRQLPLPSLSTPKQMRRRSFALFVAPWTDVCQVDLEQVASDDSLSRIQAPLMRVLHPVSSLLSNAASAVDGCSRKRPRTAADPLLTALTATARAYYTTNSKLNAYSREFSVRFQLSPTGEDDNSDEGAGPNARSCSSSQIHTRRIIGMQCITRAGHARVIADAAIRLLHKKPQQKKKKKKLSVDLATLVECLAGRSSSSEHDQRLCADPSPLAPAPSAETPTHSDEIFDRDEGPTFASLPEKVVGTESCFPMVDRPQEKLWDLQYAAATDGQEEVSVLFPGAVHECCTVPWEPLPACRSSGIACSALENESLLAALAPFVHNSMLHHPQRSHRAADLSSHILNDPWHMPEPIFLLKDVTVRSNDAKHRSVRAASCEVHHVQGHEKNDTAQPPDFLHAAVRSCDLVDAAAVLWALVLDGVDFAMADWCAHSAALSSKRRCRTLKQARCQGERVTAVGHGTEERNDDEKQKEVDELFHFLVLYSAAHSDTSGKS
jgi:hypothetical protein